MKEEYTEPKLTYIALADDVVRTSTVVPTDYPGDTVVSGKDLFHN